MLSTRRSLAASFRSGFGGEVPRKGQVLAPAVQFAIIAAFVASYFWHPAAYVRLIAEDNWGEWSTAAALALAAGLFFVCFLLGRARAWYAGLSAATLLVAMEEISWGQRIFDIPTPEALRALNFQNELTLHNIRAVSPDARTYLVVGLCLAAYGGLLPLLSTKWPRLRALVASLGLPVPSLALAPLFLAAALFLGLSGAIGLNAPVRYGPVSPKPIKGEEVGELLLALALGALAVERVAAALAERGRPHLPLGTALPGFLLVALGTGVLMTAAVEWHLGRATSSYVYWLNTLVPRMAAAGHHSPAEKLVAFLERHPELAREDLLLEKGRLLRAAGRPTEAAAAFDRALQLELRRHADSPTDTAVLGRLAELYEELGEPGLSRRYGNRLVNVYDALLEKERAPDVQLDLRIARGRVFQRMENYQAALAEYLEASEFADSAEARHQLRHSIADALALCRSGPPGRELISWEQIERLARAPDERRSAAAPCRLVTADESAAPDRSGAAAALSD